MPAPALLLPGQRMFKILVSIWIFLIVGCGGGGGGGGSSDPAQLDNPPQISKVSSEVFSDQDAVYTTGEMVKITIEEGTHEGDIAEGTIHIISIKTGYDSGVRNLSSGSIFYHWDTSGLSPSDDYRVEVKLVDTGGKEAIDNSLVITLTPNFPAINKLVSQMDMSVGSIGSPFRIQRTYLLDSGFNNSLGFGWTHSYLTHVVESEDGLVKVFNEDGSGSFFHPNSDGTYASRNGEFRTLTKNSDGTFQLKKNNGLLYRFGSSGRLETIEDRNGNLITVYYDSRGLLTAITDASSQKTTFTYNTDGRLSAITDSWGRSVYYGYDSTGNLTSFTGADGAITQYSYDGAHNLTQITDPSGRKTFYSIDAEDRLASVSNEGGVNRRLYEYGVPAANEMTVTDALGNRTIYAFDNQSSITRITDASGNMTSMTYDENLNMTSLTDAAGNQTVFTYDAKGNVVTVTDAQGNKTTTTYEDMFNQVSTKTDANGNTTNFSYDANGNLIVKTYPDGKTESFTYDGSGNLVMQTDANGNTSTFEYDTYGRLTRMTYPDGSVQVYSYDAMGNLASKTDRMAQTVMYDFDIAGRLTNKSYPDGTMVDYNYDGAGKLLNVRDQNGDITFEYDAWGRLAKVTNQDGDIVSYGYDDAGNRNRLTYPNGMELDYTYDNLNRLSAISESGKMVATYSYNSLSRVVHRELKNGSYTTYTYDPSNQLLELINRKSTSEIISSFVYAYDNVGNRLTMTTLDGLTQYNYDDSYQLTDVIYPDGLTTSYDLDPAGNRISEVVDGDRIDYTTNNLNQYTDVNGDTYTYDGNGNMTSKTTQAGVTSYAYDFENRLVQVDTATETIMYTYDPFGRRTSKTNSSGTTKFIHDGFRVILEKDDFDTIVAEYIYGSEIDEVLVMNRNGIDYFYYQDGIGSTANIADVSENIIESISYDAYGIPSEPSVVGNPYLFTGREYEPETNMYYFRARYYNPAIGRFVASDPIGYTGGNNLYSYVQNNPVNLVDPRGLQSGCPHCNAMRCDIVRWRCIFYCDAFGRFFPPFTPCPRDCQQEYEDCMNGVGGHHRGDPTFIQRSQKSTKQRQSDNAMLSSGQLVASLSAPYTEGLVRGNVPIFGLAFGTNFKQYTVQYGKGSHPGEWIDIVTSTTPCSEDKSEKLYEPGDLTIYGNLATWDTGLKNYVYLPSYPKNHPIDLKGTYTIKLVVTGKDGSAVEDRVTVDVANVIPNAWGGQVTSTDGRVVLTVPEQAIMESFRLLLIDAGEIGSIELPSRHKIIGNIYRVREPGEHFTKASQLNMAYQKEAIGDASLNQLGIYGYNPETKKWEYLKSQRDERNNFVSASVRTLHAYYALMTSKVDNEGSTDMMMPEESPSIQQANALSKYGFTFVRNTFEDGFGEWSNRDHEIGGTVALDRSSTYDGTSALKISNTHVGGNFAVNVVTTPYDVKDYQVVQFDYRISPEVKTNFLVKLSGRWYDIGFTDDPKKFEDKRVNIAHIGDIQDVMADDKWHTAQFNLYDMLRTKTGNTRVDAMIMADWDVDGYMKLTLGKNKKDATYYIDNFSIKREPFAGLQPESDVILVDTFNQMNRTNALGGEYTEFHDSQKGYLSIGFSPETSDGIGRALQVSYDVSNPESYAGFSNGLQNLDLRGFQKLSFLIKGDKARLDCMVGIKDGAGNESKVQLGRFLSGGATPGWQLVEIPLVAFTAIKDWGHVENISFGFENGICRKGKMYLDNLAFHKTLTNLKIDDFENADFRNIDGQAHYTFVSGNAAVNGKYAKGSPNGIFRISYGGNIGKINAYASDLKSFAGWRTDLGGVDCSRCQRLTMRVRGSEGGENFTVYLDDGNFRWGVDIVQHAKITTDWQTLSIPLSEFSEYGLDLTHLSALQVIFEGYEMSGTVYLDDIALQSDKGSVNKN